MLFGLKRFLFVELVFNEGAPKGWNIIWEMPFFLVGVILDTNRFLFVNVRDGCLVCDTVEDCWFDAVGWTFRNITGARLDDRLSIGFMLVFALESITTPTSGNYVFNMEMPLEQGDVLQFRVGNGKSLLKKSLI